MRRNGIIYGLAWLLGVTGVAHADGRPFIWNVSRVGDNGVQFRTGLQWPTPMQPSAGVVTQVLASDTGAISSVPVSFWSSVVLDQSQSPAASVTTQASLDYDAIARRAAFLVSEKRSWIQTGTLNVVSRRSLGLDAGGDASGSIAASQTVKLEFPAWSAALSATGSADTAARTFSKTLAVEKAIFQRVKLTADVSETDHLTTASVRLDYSIKW